MLDLSVYKSRYYPVNIDGRTIVNIEPPKRKQLKKIIALTKGMNDKNLSEEDIDNLYEAIEIAISKNKEGRIFSADEVEENFNLNALFAFFDGYYKWVVENIDQKN